jgi:hypothetical protein
VLRRRLQSVKQFSSPFQIDSWWHCNEANDWMSMACQNDLLAGLGESNQFSQMTFGFRNWDSHG